MKLKVGGSGMPYCVMGLVLHLLQNFFINLVWNEANEIFALKYSYRKLKLALLSCTKSENDIITLQGTMLTNIGR